MIKDYFKLFVNCIPVKGAKRSIICDLQRTSFKFIPNALVDLLQELKVKSIDEVRLMLDSSEDREIFESYINFLINNEFGFFCSKEDMELFPELDISIYDGSEPIITNAILEVSLLSTHNYSVLLKDLEVLGCKHIQVRSYENIDSLQLMTDILNLSESSRIRSFDFIIKYDPALSEDSFFSLTNQFSRLNEITLHTSPFKKLVKDNRLVNRLYFVEDKITSNEHCGIVSPYYFAINTEAYIHAKNRNSCLAGKISIDEYGEIKNCPSMKETFGNVHKISLKEAVIHKNYKTYWNITKDQIEVCCDCEFRYICTDCRAHTTNSNSKYGKPSKCTYNPYTASYQ